MRKAIVVPALILTLAVSAPALAGAGLPRLARLDVGQYQAQLSGDSQQVHTGTNTITVAVPGLTSNNQISLQLVGPKGQLVQVPLRPLTVLNGPEGGHEAAAVDAKETHKGQDMPAGHIMPAGHVMPGDHTKSDDHPRSDAHDSTASHGEATGGGDHGDGGHDDSAYQVRGKASLPETGIWIAVLSIDGASQEFRFQVVQGGPNRIFVGVGGSIMAAALIYGTVERRRRQSKGV